MAYEAIALVLRGVSQRVYIAGIHHGHEIQRDAQKWADEFGANVVVKCDPVTNGYSDLTIQVAPEQRDQAAAR